MASLRPSPVAYQSCFWVGSQRCAARAHLCQCGAVHTLRPQGTEPLVVVHKIVRCRSYMMHVSMLLLHMNNVCSFTRMLMSMVLVPVLLGCDAVTA